MDTTSINMQEVAFALLCGICRSKPKWLKAKTDPEEIESDFFGGSARYQTKSEVMQDATELLVRAFDSLDLYTLRKKKKKSGGYRMLSVPPDDVKQVQGKLLRWLYRLEKRTAYYCSGTYAAEQAYKWLAYKGIKHHFIDRTLHGSIQKRSVSTAVMHHTRANENFVIEFDFADAFPSVKRDVVFSVMCNILFEEFKSYFVTYMDKEYRTLGRRYRFYDVIYSANGGHRNVYKQKGFNDAYARFPLFSNKESPEFRNLVRKEAKKCERFEDTCLPEIACILAELVSQLATHDEALPQGAPTSGFLLALVLSEKKILRNFPGNVSVYVDNILVSSMRKPTSEMILRTEECIQKTGIFILNKKKTKVFDLRNQSAPILGMKLVQRSAQPDEKEKLRQYAYKCAPRGFQKRDKGGSVWNIKHLSLSQKKQKQYRALIHRCTVQDVEPELLTKAHGYIGHLVSIFGWPAPNMPSCLRKVVHAFRQKYGLYKQQTT